MQENTPPPQAFSITTHRNRIVLTCLLILGVMSWFCAMTPWVCDDYGFVLGTPGLSGLWATQVEEYLTWSGKFVGHFMSRALLRGPAWLHPLLTPIMFLALIAGGVLLSLGAKWRERLRAWHIAVLAGLVWFALPAFGTVFFWRTGTPDYGYSLTWATLFLVPYRFWADKTDFRMPWGIAFVIPGLLAGWSNENVGMLVLLTAIGVTVFHRRAAGRTPLWAVAGIVGAALGWGLMMGAPGNAVRLAAIGGADKIPLMTAQAFHRFLLFWSTEQLEMLPYFLAAALLLWLLRRRRNLRPADWLPPLVFFLMAQASIAAFVISPSTPYRAMTATFFFAALCPFSVLTSLNPVSRKGKALFLIFCVLLFSSVLLEARVFLLAGPAREARERDIAAQKITVESFAYPETDKYFFPSYDIREIGLFDTKWRDLVPWNNADPLHIPGQADIRALVASNIVFLENLPQGTVHVGARVYKDTFACLLQTVIRAVAGSPGANAGEEAVTLRYAPASAEVTEDGKAAVFIPGIRSVNDIACIGMEQAGSPTAWQCRSEP